MDHNNTIVADPLQRIVVNIFHNLEDKNGDLRSSRKEIEGQKNGYSELYWATRAVHLSHMFLVYQVWNVAGQNGRNFEREFYGWANFTHKIMLEIEGKSPNFTAKPDWYKHACTDLNMSTNETALYSLSFIRYVKELVNRDVSSIGLRD